MKIKSKKEMKIDGIRIGGLFRYEDELFVRINSTININKMVEVLSVGETKAMLLHKDTIVVPVRGRMFVELD